MAVDTLVADKLYKLHQTLQVVAKEQAIANKLKALEISLAHGNTNQFAAEVQAKIDEIMDRH